MECHWWVLIAAQLRFFFSMKFTGYTEIWNGIAQVMKDHRGEAGDDGGDGDVVVVVVDDDDDDDDGGDEDDDFDGDYDEDPGRWWWSHTIASTDLY